jgi:hypothetical protein
MKREYEGGPEGKRANHKLRLLRRWLLHGPDVVLWGITSGGTGKPNKVRKRGIFLAGRTVDVAPKLGWFFVVRRLSLRNVPPQRCYPVARCAGSLESVDNSILAAWDSVPQPPQASVAINR